MVKMFLVPLVLSARIFFNACKFLVIRIISIIYIYMSLEEVSLKNCQSGALVLLFCEKEVL